MNHSGCVTFRDGLWHGWANPKAISFDEIDRWGYMGLHGAGQRLAAEWAFRMGVA